MYNLIFILKRMALALPQMLIVSVISFLLIHLSSTDPAVLLAGDYANDADIAAIRANLGLDRSIPVSYVIWLKSILHGDFGNSIFSNMPVIDLIVQRLEPTICIACWSLILALSISLPLGILAAYRRNSWLDRCVSWFSALGLALPTFVLGYLLVSWLAIALPLFPTQGYVNLSDGLVEHLRSIALPCIALAIALSSLLTRMTRSSLLDVLSEDYIRTARAKGLSATRVMLNHGLRNAALPILTTVASSMTALIGGVVVIESVFAIPGLGRLTVDAVLRHDFAVVQASVLLSAFFCITINLTVELAYKLLDPRL